MNEQEMTEEIERLNKAVDAFAEKMKHRLIEKARKGYTGWDDPEKIPDLVQRVSNASSSATALGAKKKDAVDLANYAMMLEMRLP